jgi:excisionase family DNA binding protein
MTREVERWISSSEVAKLLAVHDKTVTRWANQGKLPCMMTLGGHHRYPEAEIRALAAQLTSRPEGNPRVATL